MQNGSPVKSEIWMTLNIENRALFKHKRPTVGMLIT